MGTEIKIHRGNQIGGCITEISTGTTRILIDFGEELPGSRNEKPFEFPWDDRKVDAVFFTHYHGDHIGRFVEAYRHAGQLYMSPLTRNVLVNIHDALKQAYTKLSNWKGGEEDAAEALRQKEMLDILADEKRIHVFLPCPGERRRMEPVEVGTGERNRIQVTPCRVDHSASDASMFLIETPDQTILHTGDFRGHGRTGQSGAAVLEDVKRFSEELKSKGKQIDVLIVEGTMMSRRNEKSYSEAELRKAVDRLLQDGHKYIFLIVSSTNLDSISTFYEAARERQIHLYCHNEYTATQLRTLGKYAWERLGVSGLEKTQVVDRSTSGEAQRRRMREEGFVTIIKPNPTGKKLVEAFKDCQPVIVYSMWQGYITRKLDPELCNFLRYWQAEGIQIIPPINGSRSPYPPMHTSGHAGPDLIASVIKTADPKEIMPIHTDNVGGFFELKISDELKDRINTGGYREEKDHRALSRKSLEKFLPGSQARPEGPFYQFIRLVQNHPEELAVCLRGNSQNAVIIYYKNHVLFHITSTGRVKFNFDHARYTRNWREYVRSLSHFSFDGLERAPKGDEFGSVGYITMPAEYAAALTLADLEELYGRFAPLIRDFSREKELVEKSVQQQLYLANKKGKGGYYFYDLEFSQPYAKALGCRSQPDMLAIHLDTSGKPDRLAFVEVKSRPASLRGSSGLKAHIQGMEAYLRRERLMRVRCRDACEILNQYIDLGLLKAPYFQKEDFAQLTREILLIFTENGTDGTLVALEQGGYRKYMEEKGYGLDTEVVEKPDGIDRMAVYRREFGNTATTAS